MIRFIATGAAGLAASCGVLAACAQPLSTPPTTAPAYVSQALADPRRPADQVSRDSARRPADVIAFAGVRPGMKVADFMSGGGYYTRLFSDVVGETGHVYAVLSAEMARNCSPEEFSGTHQVEHDASYRNVTVLTEPVMKFAAPEALDVVFTSQNYHDLHDAMNEGADVVAVDRAVFRALKPGGVFVVIDHVAEAGSGVRDTETLHRIDPAAIRREAEAAGFVLEAEGSALRNAEDDHRMLVFNPLIRGHTDQAMLRFRKPL
jgi:predicted methyltransferase